MCVYRRFSFGQRTRLFGRRLFGLELGLSCGLGLSVGLRLRRRVGLRFEFGRVLGGGGGLSCLLRRQRLSRGGGRSGGGRGGRFRLPMRLHTATFGGVKERKNIQKKR